MKQGFGLILYLPMTSSAYSDVELASSASQ